MAARSSTILQDLSSGPVRYSCRLAEIQLLGCPRGPRLNHLHQAVARGTARVTEVHEKGVVVLLSVDHANDMPQLLLRGKELRGAQQARVLTQYPGSSHQLRTTAPTRKAPPSLDIGTPDSVVPSHGSAELGTLTGGRKTHAP